MKYYLGIDGGGTRTTAAVSDENGNVICRASGKTINFYSVGMAVSRENLAEVIESIYAQIGDVTFESAFVGCSALDTEAETSVIDALCGGIIKTEKIGMNSDAYVALFSGECTEPRCVVICGTGSMALGIDGKGDVAVKGGWGHVIGDGGSAYSIAVNALFEAVCLFDEGVSDAPLVKSAEQFFGTGNLRGIIDKVYSPETTKDVIASFAKSVDVLCAEGDSSSVVIMEKECAKLVRTVSSLVNEIDDCSTIYLYGGVFQHNKIFRDLFVKLMSKKYPSVKTELLTVSPEEGALKIARGIL